jgi:mannose-6-phosphate isomerase
MVDCPYFTTNFIPLDGNVAVVNDEKSFLVYMCVEGSFELNYDGETYSYTTGDTVLIPAKMNEFEIFGKASLLEIYIS